jgi:hypothetical protein
VIINHNPNILKILAGFHLEFGVVASVHLRFVRPMRLAAAAFPTFRAECEAPSPSDALKL